MLRSYFRPYAFTFPAMMRQAVVIFSCIVLAVQASNVLEFTNSNFNDKIKDHDTILVEFYAPWCGHCKRLAPEYEKAADTLAKNDPPVSLAKVDCTAEADVCSKFGVSGYPTLKIFKAGELSKEYDGPREANGIVKTMQREAGPSSKELNTVEEYEAFLAREGGCVVGFFKDGDSAMAKTFQKVADSVDDLRFAHTTTSAIMDKAKYKDEVVLFRAKVMANKFEDSAVKFTGDATTKSKVTDFLNEEKLGLCAHRTMSNAGNFKKPTFVAFYDIDYGKNPKGSNYWRNRVMKVGKKLQDEGLKVFFGVSDKGEHSHELGECGLDSATGDKPIVCAYDDKNRKFKMEEEFSMESFEKFVRDVVDGKVEAYLKSEPIPENNDDPVKVVVAKNFDEMVNDPEKDVLIEFYAPWCGHCKSLAPKYDELAEKLKDEPEIRIAKMDATANDAPSPYEVRGFPTLFFAPKGSKSSPKKYEGGREVDDFIKYLAREATNELQGFDRKGKKKGGKKKKSEL
ncbi:protein disulfide-isomerase A3-like [Babylonia areolata]|uniref:protein disulfide-isomerase A3-like n=1 Tax=Babylonia areolata TaxID=304850 RepID=UPI003FCFCD0B